ncbi:MAG: 6-carboxytetrahydropterin synthase QueD [Bdellovibrionaceae bacterium]|nr:6-carboxytetrahydropterin synthase QueD [Pseudobdellovibrionaceae bacterium]
MKFELRQHFQIESARRLPNLPEGHPCGRLHGHSFKIILTLVGEQDPRLGWVMDYHEIETRLRPFLDQLDHRVLNDVPGLENPTSENLCRWIHDKVRAGIPALTRVTVMETPSTECSYPAREQA